MNEKKQRFRNVIKLIASSLVKWKIYAHTPRIQPDYFRIEEVKGIKKLSGSLRLMSSLINRSSIQIFSLVIRKSLRDHYTHRLTIINVRIFCRTDIFGHASIKVNTWLLIGIKTTV